MEWFKEIFNQVSTLFKWWIIVLPWESGIRIRLGKREKILDAGFHFRIPYLDSVYVQPTRLSFFNLSPQTLTTKSGETLTICLIVGYSIKDLRRVYNSVGEIQSVITGTAMGLVSQYVCNNTLAECSPHNIEGQIREHVQSLNYGVDIKEVNVTSYAVVKTFRVIQDSHWMANDHKLDSKI